MKYLDSEEFLQEIIKSQKADKATERFGEMILALIDHYMHSPCFSAYSTQTKEDMRGSAIIKCLKALNSFDSDRGAKAAFSYFTAAVNSGLLGELAKVYKHINVKRELTRQALIYDAENGYGDKRHNEEKIKQIEEVQREVELRKLETQKKKEAKRMAKGLPAKRVQRKKV